MASIDKKIVEMQLDNKNFESNAKNTLSTVERMKKVMDFGKVGESLSGVGKAASGIDMSSISSAAETVTGRLSTLGIVGVTALMNITNSAIDAGAQLLKSLTVTPITQGFAEYELKMGSIQTIMASTGAPLDAVNDKLEELNLYADKTIYSFSDMTSNIGKFTNAGVGLDDAVAAIQGVSNVAAVSGANANEASRAMYNFAQALSAGHVKLIDWKSIENANMATVEFKTQLMESAVAAGTLEKRADGMYNVLSTNSSGKTMKTAISATSNFNESLEYQWMTTNALVGTLGDYADETTEIGKKAFAAAQDVKTFTQLIDTLQEAVGSGWGATFELLVGDFEEAKTLFTDMSDAFGGAIGRSADARNEMLKGWKDLGGRTVLIEAIGKLFNNLTHIISAIAEGFREIFPKQTAEGLYALTKGFADFIDKLWLNDMALEAIYNTSKGFFSILKLITSVVGVLFKGFGGLVSALTPLLRGLLTISGALGDFIATGTSVINLTDLMNTAFEYLSLGVKTAATWISNAFAGIGDTVNKWTSFIKIDTSTMADAFESDTKRMTFSLDPVKEGFMKVWTVIKNVYDKIRPVLKAIGDVIAMAFTAVTTVLSNLFAGFSALDFENVLNVGVFTAVGLGIKKFFDTLNGPAESITKMMDSLSNILDGVRKSFEAWQQNLQAKTLMKIALSIAILAASLWVLSTIPSEKLLQSLGAIGGLFVALFSSLAIFSKIMKAGGLEGMGKVAASMILLSIAVLILAGAVKKLSDIPWTSLVKGLGALVVIMASLVATSKYLSKDASEIAKVSAALVIFGLAIAAIAKSVKTLGAMSWEELLKGLGAITIIIAELIFVSKALVGNKDMVVAAANLKSLGAAIVIIALAVKILGGMPINKLIKGLGSVTVVLGALTVAARSLPSDMAARAAGMVVLSTAIIALSVAVQILGRMPIKKLLTGIGGLAAVLTLLVVAVNAISKDVVGIGGIMALAVAVNLLIVPLILLGSMPFNVITQGLFALAGIFFILAAASMALTPVAPTLLTIAGSFALFGLAIAGIGAGVLALSVGLVALGASAGVIGAGIVALMGGLVLGLTVFMKGLGQIVAAFIDSLGTIVIGMASTFLKIVTNVISMILTTIINSTPTILGGILELLSVVFTTLVEHMPRFMETGAQFIMGFLDGLTSNMSGVIESASNLITTFLGALTEHLPAIGEAGVNFLTEILEGITLGLPALVEGAVALVVSFVETLTEQIPLIVTTAVDFIVAMAQTLIDNLPRIVETAVEIIVTFVTALGDQLPVIIDAAFKLIIDFANGLADAIRENTGDLLAAGVNIVTALVEGIVDGVFKMLPMVWDSAKEIVGKVVGAIKDGFTWLKDNGWDIIKNVVNGILGAVGNLGKKVWNGAKDIVGNVLGAIKDGLTGLWDAGWDIAKNVVDGILGGIGKLGKSVWDGAKSLGSKMLGGIGNFLGIASPSKEMFKIGAWSGEGVVNGLASMGKSVVKGATSLGQKVLDPVNAAMTSLVDSIERDVDYQPVITPVVNTTEMDKGLKGIKGAMTKAFDTTIGNVSVLSGASRPTRDTTKPNGQNGSTKGQDNSVTNNNFTLGGTYHIREESDIHKVAKELHNLTKKKARA